MSASPCGLRLGPKRAIARIFTDRPLAATEAIPISIYLIDVESQDTLFRIWHQRLDHNSGRQVDADVQFQDKGLAIVYSEQGFARLRIARGVGENPSDPPSPMRVSLVLDVGGREFSSPEEELTESGFVEWVVGK
jgi:hypothetical protein